MYVCMYVCIYNRIKRISDFSLSFYAQVRGVGQI